MTTEEGTGTTAAERPATATISISGDVVNRATADLPDDQRSAIRWFHGHATTMGWSLREAAEKIRRDPNTLYQVWTGRHAARKDEITREILAVQKLAIERQGLRRLGFIETDLSRKIWQVCDAARAYQRIALVFGDSQIGKTSALLAYQRAHNHGETVYVSTPTSGAMLFFVPALARALRISPALREVIMRERIISAFDDRMLLIVDEAHQCFATTGHKSENLRAARALEFIREIHDRSGCGVVLSATNVLREEMESGKAAGVLTQLKRRRLVSLRLPSIPSPRTLAQFAAAYGLEPAEGDDLKLQADVIKGEALGMWLTTLRMASNRATKAGRPLTWADVRKAHALLRSLEHCD